MYCLRENLPSPLSKLYVENFPRTIAFFINTLKPSIMTRNKSLCSNTKKKELLTFSFSAHINKKVMFDNCLLAFGL